MSRLPALSLNSLVCLNRWESRAAGAGQRREDVKWILFGVKNHCSQEFLHNQWKICLCGD
ncbi:MAG: hypothetical protein F6K22_16140 [Okeania sp. SIO2F4]|uniref:hypothetical protein n=1 Tax=Okeania sp. SIO2F4 TaxID=2607790 RepID=UPI001429E23E|nr:hypothetical protein [Okeania sp. SIO2F4]NES04226.1 hypothetical protein [Okeania sp. SIO2F4]